MGIQPRHIPPQPEPPPEATGSWSGRMRRARHLLVVSDDVESQEIEALALSRFPATHWQVEPHPGKGNVLEPGFLTASRHSRLIGPYVLDPTNPKFWTGVDQTSLVFDVVCPHERGEAPVTDLPDRDGLARSFFGGLPMREESRVVQWLIAAARRLGGSVLFDEEHLVTPDPGALIDMTVFSDVWLDPEAAVATVRTVAPGAEFPPVPGEWEGPPADILSNPLPGGLDVPPEVRQAIHEAADEFDMATLSNPEPAAGYAIHVDLGVDGLVAVEISGEETLPTSLAGLPWADQGAISYRVRWFPEHPEELELADPSLAHRASRERVAPQIADVTARIHQVVGGEIADQDDFLISSEDL